MYLSEAIFLKGDAMYSRQFKMLCKEVLTKGRKLLNLETGIVSRFQTGQYEIIAIESKENVFVAGESYTLHNTICAQTAEQKKTIAITPFPEDFASLHHPLYVPKSLRTYIGSPILIDNFIWGTINFTSFYSRTKPFDAIEILYIEWCAARISTALQTQSKEFTATSSHPHT